MASKRVFGHALRCSEKLAAASSAPNTRCFTSHARNWAAQSTAQTGRTVVSRFQHTLRLAGAATIPRRAFSSSPASRHGHLDKPNPGEECVPCHTTSLGKPIYCTDARAGCTSHSSTRTANPTPLKSARETTCWTLPRPTISRWKAPAGVPAPARHATLLSRTRQSTKQWKNPMTTRTTCSTWRLA